MNSGEAGGPLLVYDGECAFCRTWIERWKRWTGGRVACQPFQAVANSFPQIPIEDFKHSVQLILPDGAVLSGAHAVLWTLAFANRRKWLLRAYERVPGFGRLAESMYQLVARHR